MAAASFNWMFLSGAPHFSHSAWEAEWYSAKVNTCSVTTVTLVLLILIVPLQTDLAPPYRRGLKCGRFLLSQGRLLKKSSIQPFQLLVGLGLAQ